MFTRMSYETTRNVSVSNTAQVMINQSESHCCSNNGMQKLVGPIVCGETANGIAAQDAHIASQRMNSTRVIHRQWLMTARTRRKYWKDDDAAESTRSTERTMTISLQLLIGAAKIGSSEPENISLRVYIPFSTATEMTKAIVDNLMSCKNDFRGDH